MEPLATIEELAARLAFEMDDDDKREAEGALESLSDDARFYGKSTWIDPTVTPPQICRLVLKAANRYMKNFDGFAQSRAGDETVTWSNQDGEDAGSPHFTSREVAQLRQLAGESKLFSAPLTTGPRSSGFDERCYVPDPDGGEPIPYFADPVEPW